MPRLRLPAGWVGSRPRSRRKPTIAVCRRTYSVNGSIGGLIGLTPRQRPNGPHRTWAVRSAHPMARRPMARRKAPPGTGISAACAITLLFVLNRFGCFERRSLRPGNVHSADGRENVLKPVLARYAVLPGRCRSCHPGALQDAGGGRLFLRHPACGPASSGSERGSSATPEPSRSNRPRRLSAALCSPASLRPSNGSVRHRYRHDGVGDQTRGKRLDGSDPTGAGQIEFQFKPVAAAINRARFTNHDTARPRGLIRTQNSGSIIEMAF